MWMTIERARQGGGRETEGEGGKAEGKWRASAWKETQGRQGIRTR